MLTWGVVIALAIGVYGQRAIGMVALDSSRLTARAKAVLDAMPLAIVCAVIALQTFSRSGELTFDARVAGVAAAAVSASLRLPMFVTVIVAAATTAAARAVI